VDLVAFTEMHQLLIQVKSNRVPPPEERATLDILQKKYSRWNVESWIVSDGTKMVSVYLCGPGVCKIREERLDG